MTGAAYAPIRATGLTALLPVLTVVMLGCGGRILDATADYRTRQFEDDESAREALIDAKADFAEAVEANPDLPTWYAQREQRAFAVGDRQYDQAFERVFDSTTVALATLGCRVYNMERASGYVAATIPRLPPEKMRALTTDAAREQVAAKGFPAAVLEKSDSPDDIAVNASVMMAYGLAGLTLSVVRQGPSTTKLKLRFDKVYYPALVDEYYSLVWRAIDKQMFLDKGLD